jgi:CDP-diacylglycerol--glycerol-3-phosphate 3-phosphatidyltransferase
MESMAVLQYFKRRRVIEEQYLIQWQIVLEALWLVALYRIGVPAWITIVLWVIASIQEYARARLSSLDVKDLGVVTPVERPVRASFIFIALIMWHTNISGVTYLSIAYLVLQTISFYLVVRFARSQLH